MRSTPFVATAPLDILAGVFFMLSLFSVFLGICIISAVTFAALDIDVYLDYKGYDIMMLKSGALPRGFGINFAPGFEVWRYIENGPDGKIEFRLHPA